RRSISSSSRTPPTCWASPSTRSPRRRLSQSPTRWVPTSRPRRASHWTTCCTGMAGELKLFAEPPVTLRPRGPCYTWTPVDHTHGRSNDVAAGGGVLSIVLHWSARARRPSRLALLAARAFALRTRRQDGDSQKSDASASPEHPSTLTTPMAP